VELKGERVLPVDRTTAWQELNNVEALKAAVPGCESLAAIGEGEYEVAVNAAIGPVKSLFKGKMKISDAIPPESYAVAFDLHGGLAGFARGQAKVALHEAAARETRMVYEVNSSVGGKIALVGSRLVDAAAATMSDRFFATFAAQLAAKYPQAGPAAAEAPKIPGFFATLWAFLKRLFGRS
jgi:carbon monoxide dehydrogenase subunit G